MNYKGLAAACALVLAGPAMAGACATGTTNWGDMSAPGIVGFTNSFSGPGSFNDCYTFSLTSGASAFGGVIGVNRPIDVETATEMAKLFLEVIAAPGFDVASREIFAAKKNLRLVEVVPMEQKWVLKNVSGGVLLQDNDMRPLTDADLKAVSERKPTEQEIRDLLFAWKICKHVKSNAILYARNGQSTGVGAGQMSRVDSARIGAMKSVLGIKGSVAASDAFFPFPDGVEVIAEAGATAIIQPGGSVRDQEVIDTANKLGLAMVLTGVRHFRH